MRLVLLEQTHTIAAIRSCEVHAIFTHDEVLNRWGLVVTDFGLLSELLVFSSDGINNTDSTITLTDQKLSTVGSEFHDREDFAVIIVVLGILFTITCLVVFIPFLKLVGNFSPLCVVPKDNETFGTSDRESSLLWVDSNSCDARFEAVHKGLTLILAALNCFENSRLKLNNHGAAVSNDKITTGESILLINLLVTSEFSWLYAK